MVPVGLTERGSPGGREHLSLKPVLHSFWPPPFSSREFWLLQKNERPFPPYGGTMGRRLSREAGPGADPGTWLQVMALAKALSGRAPAPPSDACLS